MDITSYLLGKNSSGGGGGGSDLDWSAIGFSKEPDMRVEEGYDYAVEIKNSWRASTSLMNKYVNDYKLMFMPSVDTSTATNMQSMFGDCYSLTDTSLDNILQMCINATSYTGTKKLKTLGFEYNTMTSIYNVARIQALPHYQDFIDAGWTIGY